MDRRLYQVCVEGNIASLMELMREDPLVLERTITTTFSETPLHIVAMLGHVDFAKEILSRSPKLAIELDSTGFYPLHVASTRDNVEMIRELLRVAPEVCLTTDTEGRTPLHLATMKGHIEIMKELFQCQPEAINQVLWNWRETIFHLCVNHNRLEALKLLLQWVIDVEGPTVSLNSKDEQGNTILHLAVANKNIQIMKLLLFSNNNGKEEELKRVEVNELNRNGLTALDIVAESCVKDVKDMEIGEMIRGAGGLRAKELQLLLAGNNNNGSPSSSDNIINIRNDGNSSDYSIVKRTGWKERSNSWRRNFAEHEKWLKKKQNMLMVVASLIASMAFQAMLNPPSCLTEQIGGKQIDSHSIKAVPPTATTTTSGTDPSFYLMVYMISNTTGFVASLSVTILLVSGLPITRRFFIWVLMFILWVATTSMGSSYVAAIFAMEEKYEHALSFPVSTVASISWNVLNIFLFLMHTTRFMLWILRKKGRITKRIFLVFWCPLLVGAVVVFYLFLFQVIVSK